MSTAWKSTEVRFICILMVTSAVCVLWMGHLIAQPKILFGRSLTAIAPALFPTLVLTGVAGFGLAVLILLLRDSPGEAAPAAKVDGLGRGTAFFAIMTGYALTMEPLGFFIASSLTIALTSWLVGNRTLWQIALLSIVAPALLYNIATRLLAVSLPELDVIERAYASVFGG